MKEKETPLGVKIISVWFYVLVAVFLFLTWQAFIVALFSGYYILSTPFSILLPIVIFFSLSILSLVLAIILKKGKSWYRKTTLVVQAILSLVTTWNISKIIWSLAKSDFVLTKETIIIYLFYLGLNLLILSCSLLTIFYLLFNKSAKEFFRN